MALELLNRVEREHGDALTARCRYRIDANKAYAYERKGDFERAGRLYVSASEYQPDDRDAGLRAAKGHLLLGHRERAYDVAAGLLEDFSEFTTARAIWLQAAPDEVPFAELESATPEHQRDDGEVAVALARVATARGELEKAEEYARRAVKSKPDWVYARIELAQAILAKERAK